MFNTFQDFRDNPDKETLLQMWCELITAMAEDKNAPDKTMAGLLANNFDLAIVQLCGLTPSQLYDNIITAKHGEQDAEV